MPETPTIPAAGGGSMPSSPVRGAPPSAGRAEDPRDVTRSVDIRPASYNAKERTVDLVAAAGATVLRYDWWTGERYYEELLCGADNVDLTRFEASRAPLLNTHWRYDVSNVMGKLLPGTARFEGGEFLVTAKMSGRADVAPYLQDIAEGILSNVSVGYRVLAYEVDETTKPVTRRITKWELLEVSFVPVGADGVAGTRSLDTAGGQSYEPMHPRASAPNVNVTVNVADHLARAATAPHPDNQEDPMSVKTTGAGSAQDEANRNADAGAPGAGAASDVAAAADTRQPAATPTPAPTSATDDLKAQRQAEAARMTEIRALGVVPAYAVTDDELKRAIEEGTSVEAFRRQIMDRLAAGDEKEPKVRTAANVDVGRDETQTRIEGVTEYLLYRTNSQKHKLTEKARDYIGLSCVEIARQFIGGARGLDRAQVITRAMNTTGDFPQVLGATLRRTLRDSYEAVDLTFVQWARRSTLPDFRETTRVRLGAAPALLKVNEAGEIKAGSFKDGGAPIQLATYGRQLRVTRQMLINDDLGAFTRIPQAFGGSAARLQNDIVWQLLTSNPTLGDGIALFHADHGNIISGAGSAFSVKAIGDMDTKIGLQQDDNKAELNLMLRWLMLPREMRVTAANIASGNVKATKTDDAIPKHIQDLGSVVDGRLSRNSALKWYGAADPNQFDTVEYAYLEGEESIQTTEMEKVPGVDGLAMEARIDFAAAVIDYRGLCMSVGQ